ncbi:hypothetical protein Cal6303_1074 [Calothrix sp. PCC 6303]|nr:hypothetical protein Cal6303_1074 [Calothrix sp. PCC 6303]
MDVSQVWLMLIPAEEVDTANLIYGIAVNTFT